MVFYYFSGFGLLYSKVRNYNIGTLMMRMGSLRKNKCNKRRLELVTLDFVDFILVLRNIWMCEFILSLATLTWISGVFPVFSCFWN